MPETQTSDNVFTPSEPLQVDGRTLTSLALSKPGLKGKFMSNLAAEYRQKFGELPTVPIRDEDYRILLVARLNGIDITDLQDGLSAEDYTMLSTVSLSFLNVAAGKSTREPSAV